MASRLAVLSLLSMLMLAGCVNDLPVGQAVSTCVSCHPVHHADRGTCSSCHGGDEKAARATLAHDGLLHGEAAMYRFVGAPAVVDGGRLVETLACRRCHTIGRRGNRLATSLDAVVWTRSQEELMRSIGEPAGEMPRFALSIPQTERVIAWMLNRGDRSAGHSPYSIHFADRANGSPMFEKLCGGCHRALLAPGPAGRGSAGPNLSGLLTGEYPRTARGAGTWTRQELQDWLRNPRAVRATAAMRPIPLQDSERSALLAELVPQADAPASTVSGTPSPGR